jgi:hypothetical protein
VSALEIAYAAPKTVADFMESDAFFRLIVGPVGSGKSSGCCVEIIRRAVEQAQGPDGIRRTRFLVMRNTFPQLRDTTRKTFEQWIPAAVGTWNEQALTFTMRFADVECEVLFRALDRPEDKKKLLSLELTGAYLNEMRELPGEVFDLLQSRVGRYPSRKQGGPTWFGVWGDTNPMHTGHWLYNLMKLNRPARFALFEQPSGLSPDAENAENLPPGYYPNLCDGKDEEWVGEYIRAQYPKRDKGSVYGDALTALQEVGALLVDFAHPTDGVFVNFDLGVSDATSMWWWRPNGVGGVDALDAYESTGKPLEHFIDELKKREELGWQYTRVVLPHDARNRVLTGSTVFERMQEAFPGRVDVLPNLPLEQGISSARWLLEKLCRFHVRCEEGVKALRAYKYEWDVDRKVFSRKPVHDWSSHYSDGFRYLATYAKQGELLARVLAPKPPEKKRSGFHLTLDEAYALGNERHRSHGRVD